jgi:hypothetical protein
MSAPYSRDSVVASERAKLRGKSLAVMETTPERARHLRGLLEAMPGLATDTQVERLYAAMKTGPVTVIEARGLLDVAHPPQCVLVLRRSGVEVWSEPVRQASASNVLHRTAAYSLPHE